MKTTHEAFKIVFEDANLIVLSKAPGLLSQGDVSGEVNLVDLLRQHVGRHYVGLVHRLDRNTSGLMVVAKRSKAAQRLTEALKKKLLNREYLALVMGSPSEAEFVWRDFLIKDEKKNKVRVQEPRHEKSQLAVLRGLRLATGKWQGVEVSCLRLNLETGRSHQIRAQAASRGHPLLGDVKYGGDAVKLAFHRPALHSASIEFPHPISKELMRFEDSLPADMSQVMREACPGIKLNSKNTSY